MDNHTVWVLPNGRTLGLAAVLVAMCYAGASQSNGAAYLLCFVLTSLAIVSLVHAWANLHGLGASVEAIPPVFATDDVVVPIVLTSKKGGSHFGLEVSVSEGPPTTLDCAVVPESPSHVEVRFPSPGRGHYRAVPLLSLIHI